MPRFATVEKTCGEGSGGLGGVLELRQVGKVFEVRDTT